MFDIDFGGLVENLRDVCGPSANITMIVKDRGLQFKLTATNDNLDTYGIQATVLFEEIQLCKYDVVGSRLYNATEAMAESDSNYWVSS
tara:strand:- start:19695 stop:19958 length:264 start_codon:yes stop_codon:yes gene_type:complete